MTVPPGPGGTVPGPENTALDADGGEGLLTVPAFDAGGRVERTGIALVHEGEYVMPAPGSEAMISSGDGAAASDRMVWSFPVEVEVIGKLSDTQLDAVAAHVFDEIDVALRRRGRG